MSDEGFEEGYEEADDDYDRYDNDHLSPPRAVHDSHVPHIIYTRHP